MGYEYYTIENALYGHKTDLKEVLGYNAEWSTDKPDDPIPSRYVWIYPPERPPHDPWQYKMRKMREEDGPFEMWLQFFTEPGGREYRTFAAPGWLVDEVEEWRQNFDSVRSERKSIYPTGDYFIIADVGARGGIRDLRVVGEVKNH